MGATQYKSDYIGKRFGRLTVIKFFGRNKHGRQLWQCQCECGIVKNIPLDALKGKITMSCGCYQKERYWSGYEEISGTFWKYFMKRSIERGYVFEITIEQVWDLYIKQNKKCKLSGLPIHLERGYSNKNYKQTASIDRIDPSGGYTIDNIQWLHKSINKIKGVLTDDELIMYCKVIYNNNKDRADKLDIDLENTNAWRLRNSN